MFLMGEKSIVRKLSRAIDNIHRPPERRPHQPSHVFAYHPQDQQLDAAGKQHHGHERGVAGIGDMAAQLAIDHVKQIQEADGGQAGAAKRGDAQGQVGEGDEDVGRVRKQLAHGVGAFAMLPLLVGNADAAGR